MKAKDILTTGDVASICKCSHDTVKRWLEGERLPGHRLPLQGQWRILPKDLLQFMERHGIPIDEEANALLGLPEPPVRDFVYCWEFHQRNKSRPAVEGRSCEECLVFKTKAKDCFVLREHVGHQQIFCRSSCEECDYYRYVTEMGVPDSGVEA